MKSWLKRAEIFGLFVGLFLFPIFLSFHGFRLLWQSQVDFGKQESFERLDHGLDRLENFRDTGNVYHRILLHCFLKSDKSRDPLKAWKLSTQKLKHRYPGTFSFITWDPQGNVIDLLSDEKGYRVVLKKIWEALRQIQVWNDTGMKPESVKAAAEFKPYLSAIVSFLGNMLNPNSLFAPIRKFPPPSVIPLSLNPKRFSGWFRLGKHFGTFCLMGNKPFEGYPFLNAGIHSCSFRAGKEVFGYWDLSAGKEPEVGSLTPDLAEITSGILRVGPSGESHFESGKFLVSIRPLEKKMCLFGFIPMESALPYIWARDWIFGFFLVSFHFPLLYFCYLLIFPTPSRYVSIRGKLVGLFLAANVIPLAVLLFVGFSSFQQKREALIRQQIQGLTEHLQGTDSNYSGFPKILAAKFLRPLVEFLENYPAIDPGPVEVQEILRRALKEGGATEAFISTMDSKMLGSVRQPGKSPAVAGVYDFLNKLTVTGCQRKKENSLGPGSAGGPPAAVSPGSGKGDFVFNVSGIKILVDPSVFTGYPSILSIELMDFSEKTTVIFLQRQTAPYPRYGVSLLWDEENFTRKYFRYALKREKGVSSDIRKVFFELSDGKLFSRNLEVSPDLKLFLEQSQKLGAPYSRPIQFPSGEFLGVSRPGTLIRGTILAALYPMRKIDKKAAMFRNRLVLFSWLSFGLIAGLSMYLAHQFLLPIGELALSASAIQSRTFSFRISEVGDDELGDLGVALNRMMEGLEELNVARHLQESLAPRNAVRKGNLEIFGKTIPMREVGGDIVEIFDVPGPTGLGVFIGDVSGHGVSAALFTVAVKTALKLHQESWPRPAELLGKLNSLVQRLSAGKKIMVSAGVFYLDSLSGSVTFSNAGQTYPLLIRKGKKAEFLDLVGYPLGSHKKAEFRETQFVLGPGDSFVLYSDGYVECRNSWGEEFGYDRFRERIDKSRHSDPIRFMEHLFRQNLFHRGSAEEQDDVTLVVGTFSPDHSREA